MMVEVASPLTVLLSLAAALAAACNQVFVRKGTVGGKASIAVLTVMGMNLLVLLPFVTLSYYPKFGLTPSSWLSFFAAGTFGTLFGRVCMYSSIEKIGASRTAPIIASNAVLATILGVLFLGET